MNSVATSSGGRIGDAEEQPTRAPPAASFTSLPLELTIKILALLDPLDVLAARQTSRALAHATRSLSLWRSIAHSLSERLPLSALPSRPSRSRQRSFLAESSVISTETAENELAEDLERHALSARQLEKRWDTEGAEPRAVFRTRAHIDRVTCLKLVVGRSRIVNSDTSDRDCQNNGRGKAAEGVHVSALGGRGGEGSNLPCSRRGGAQLQTRRWLVTGAVDGFIRVWDLSGSLPDMRDHEYDRRRAGGDTELYNEEAADLRASGGSAEAGAGAGAAGGESSSAPAGSSRSSDFRRRTKGLLLAEIDTKADVTAIDAELGDNGETMRIAVGSYYSGAGCQVYVLRFSTQPPFLDLVGALSPPHWCGTQCVSLRGDRVAVGTYTGLLHVFDWRTGWRGGIERNDKSSTAAVKLFPHHILSVTRLGTIELFSLPVEIGLQSDEKRTDRAEPAPSPSPSPSQPSKNAFMSLSDTPPAPAPASLAEKSYRMPGELLARHAITEGSKPLLSVSFGETHARKAGGISRDDLMASAAELDDEGLEEEGGTERKWEALALVALDLGGMTHIVFDPLDPSSTTMGEDGSFRVNVAACDSPRASSSTAISTPFAVPPACAAEVPPFPYVFPPRVITRQTVSGERLIGAATGATGKRAIMFSSLGGVPPVCCVRGYAPIRLRSPTRTLKENSEGEVSSSTGQSSDCADVSLENRESGGKGSTSLWVPLRPIPDVHLPVPLAKRLSIPNPIPLAAQSSSAAPATATAAATGATRPAATQFPSPSSSRASSVSSVRSGRSLFAGGGVGAGASAGAGAGAGGHGPAAHAQPGADDRPDVTDRGIGTGIGAMPSTTTTTTMLPSAGNSAPLSSPTGSSSPSPIFASNQSRSFNQTLSSAGANVNASASPPSPLPSPSLPSPSSASTPTTTSRSVPSSASASTSTSSSTVFGGAGFASRADILTEAVMDEAGGLVCLATARGNLWVADYGQGPRR